MQGRLGPYQIMLCYNDRTLIIHKLFGLKYSLNDVCTLFHYELMYGLTDKVIEDIVLNSDKLFSTACVFQNHPIWSYDVAVNISDIIRVVLSEDLESHVEESDSDD